MRSELFIEIDGERQVLRYFDDEGLYLNKEAMGSFNFISNILALAYLMNDLGDQLLPYEDFNKRLIELHGKVPSAFVISQEKYDELATDDLLKKFLK